MKFNKDDLLDLCVTIRLPDPNDPKTGGTLEHFVMLCDAITKKWGADLQGMDIDVFRTRVDQINISQHFPRNGQER